MLNATVQPQLWSEEEWRPVPEYEGLYQISSWGQVWSMPRATTRGGIMKQTLTHGRLVVTLTRNGVQRVRLVHQLVAEAFLEEQPEGTEVCHGDGDPTNNHVENLRYDTHASNMQDMFRHGTAPSQAITHCPYNHEYTEDNTRWYEGRRFCITCADEVNQARSEGRERPKPMMICPWCDTEFQRPAGRGAWKYCSSDCRDAARRDRWG